VVKRPEIPPKREIKGDIKFPRPEDIHEKYYGKPELNPKAIDELYKGKRRV
jgi:hypothetical protein